MEQSLFDAVSRVDPGEFPDDVAQKEIFQRYGTTCAVLVLDSDGFSVNTRVHGIACALSFLQRMRCECSQIFKQYGVIEWRGFADNIFAEFKSVDDAVLTAFAVHSHYETLASSAANDNVAGVSIGIGYGRLLRSGAEGVFGEEMNLASKLGEDIARVGETLLTEAAFGFLSCRDGCQAERRAALIAGEHTGYFSIKPASRQ